MAKRMRTKHHEYVSEATTTAQRRKLLQRIYDRNSSLKASTEIRQRFEVTCFRLGRRNDTKFPEDMQRWGFKPKMKQKLGAKCRKWWADEP